MAKTIPYNVMHQTSPKPQEGHQKRHFVPTLSTHIRSTLSTAIILIPILGVLVWNSVRLINNSQQIRLEQTAQEHSILLAEALASKLAANNHMILLDTLDLLKDNRTLSYAAVFDSHHRLLASLGNPPPLAQHFSGDFQHHYRWMDDLYTIEHPIIFEANIIGVLQTGYSIRQAQAITQEIGTQNSLIALLGLLLVTFFVAFTNVPIIRGLNRLEVGVRALSSGEWSHRIADNGSTTGPVAKAINKLAADVQSNWNQTRNQYSQVIQESRRLNNLLHGIHAIIWEVDPKTGSFQYVSPEIQRLSGYSINEWKQADFCQRHIHPSDLDWIQNFLTHPGNVGDTLTLDFRLFNDNGYIIWLRMISTVEIRNLGPILTGVLLDVTDEKHNAQQLAYLADHDNLTGLINRRHFQELLDTQIFYSQRYKTEGVLLLLDLDQFKYINDTYGHHVGDEYLRQVSQHLNNRLRKTDTLGRLGGDEFGVILPHMNSHQCTRVCESLLQYLNALEFVHEGHRTAFRASIGAVLFPTQGNQADELLAKADSAMYQAKDRGRNTYRVFEENTDVIRMHTKIHWEQRICIALKENRFQLFFQPIVDINTGVVRHYESLLRMRGDDGEIIAPGAFIGIAERFNFIRDIDRWVVANAIRIQGESIKNGQPVSLTINLSGRHFGSHEIMEVIQESTRRYHANPKNIVFEVTETAAIENFAYACDFIQALRDMGYHFALDDFGAGFSSFDYLKNMPVDYVKIDGAFIRHLDRARVDQIFVKAITEMSSELGIQVIAEFVETEEVVDALKHLGVHLGQGYLFAKPSPHFLQLAPATNLSKVKQYA